MMTLQMTNLYMTFEVAHDPFPAASIFNMSRICLSGRFGDISAIDPETDISKVSTQFLIKP